MKCPICNQEMERGFVQSGTRIIWTKRIHKISLLPKDGDVLLLHSVLKPSAIPASICKKCEKIIMDYSKIEDRES